jgi:single-strand selective monofunctional uracil DNA glycosylase
VDQLSFGPKVAYVYNPLSYAASVHEAYLYRAGSAPKEVLLLGMNPGPFGMVQTGVPFGDACCVRDFLGLTGRVGRPDKEHPKRLVQGLSCTRREVSGTRLWGWAAEDYGTADSFFTRFFIANYCPLAFLEASGRNLTPDKLPANEKAQLFAICDKALRETVAILRPSFAIGIGAFATERLTAALEGVNVVIGTVLHPSPASPIANRGWASIARRQLHKILGKS